MSGLGAVTEQGTTFLSIAGGFIWDRKADKEHPHYATQDYEKADKSTGTRAGARYGDLTGRVTKVAFRTHPEYGESLNVTFKAGKEFYTVSVSTNNRYSQDLMKALLVMDLEEVLFMKPYDFVGSDKKRAQGISFKQDGAKLDLKNEDAPSKDSDWFKKSEKKAIKRFFEDLNDWYIAEIEEKIIPNIKEVNSDDEEEEEEAPKVDFKKASAKKKAEKAEEDEEDEEDEAPKKVVKKAVPKASKKEKEEAPSITPLGMKKVLRAYISENYEGLELPSLEKADLKKWYDLAVAQEELPFDEIEEEEDEEEEGEMTQEEIDAELDKLV